MADDRFKYLGELDMDSLTPAISESPGPLYNPNIAPTQVRSQTVAFGGYGPNTMIKPPTMKIETPGPGAYTPTPQNATLSTKPRVVGSSFGTEPRGTKALMDSSACYHKKVCPSPHMCPHCQALGGAGMDGVC
jgi:hypothetical protein